MENKTTPLVVTLRTVNGQAVLVPVSERAKHTAEVLGVQVFKDNEVNLLNSLRYRLEFV